MPLHQAISKTLPDALDRPVKMPAFGEKLGKEDISALAAYVKTLEN